MPEKLQTVGGSSGLLASSDSPPMSGNPLSVVGIDCRPRMTFVRFVWRYCASVALPLGERSGALKGGGRV